MRYKKISIVFAFILIFILVFSGCTNKKIEHRMEWYLESLNWESEQRNGLDGSGVRIALIDSGVDLHDDIKHSVEETIVLTSNKNLHDYCSVHATAMAGVMTALPHDTSGLLGIAPQAKIISIDVTCDSDGNIDTKRVIKAIYIAINRDVDIINLSLSIAEDDNDLHDAIKMAYKKGIIVIASAGNVYNGKDIAFPARYEEVICVGSYTKEKKYLYPKVSCKNIVYLPGYNIVSCSTNNDYDSFTGTSISTAMLSGVIALIKQKYPDVNFKQLIEKFNNQPGQMVQDIPKLLEVKYD